MDFIIDTVGDEDLLNKTEVIGEVCGNEFENVGEEKLQSLLDRIKISWNEIESKVNKEVDHSRKLADHKYDDAIKDFYHEMGWQDVFGKKYQRRKKKYQLHNINLNTGKFNVKSATADIEKEMKKTVLTPGIEKDATIPEYDVSERRKKAMRKAEREKTKGPSWYNMAAPEMTDELKNDLQLLKMRSVLDPKRFYKHNDMEVLPKYFQVGTVMDSALVHQKERLSRKDRKRTIVDELLDDADFNRYNKRKYKEIVEDKKKHTWKTYIKEKRMKSKQAFKKNRANKQKGKE